MGKEQKNFKKWDTHHHINPPFYEAYTKKNGYDNVYGLPHPKWSPDLMLHWMDEANIERAVMSISTPGIHFGSDAESREMSRKCNHYMADLIKKYPNRLGAFATLPLPDTDGAVKELRYALDTLKLDGIGLLSNFNHHYFGDVRFEPVWQEANDRKAIVYVHPTRPKESIPQQLLNYTYYLKMDTAKTIISFMKSGYHLKYPHIKFILSHGGGVLPKVMKSALQALKKEDPSIEESFEVWRKQLFADTALVSYPDVMLPEIINFFGANHVIFGTDLCWGADKYKYFIEQFSETDISMEMFEKIYLKNVNALFRGENVPYMPTKVKLHAAAHEPSVTNYHLHIHPKNVIALAAEKYNGEIKMDHLNTEIKPAHTDAMISFDIPEVWKLSRSERRKILTQYNLSISKMKQESAINVKVLAAIDLEDPEHSINEITHCLNVLKMDGICLYVSVTGKSYHDMFDDRLLMKLAQIDVPVVIHPKASDAFPVLELAYYETLAYIFCLIYSDKLAHLKQVNYIPTHTDGLLEFLGRAVNSMHYVNPKTDKPRIGKIIWELLIMKREVVYEYLKGLDVY
jgi:predicted TIM-barrel fold metal-dependent hydrolase